MSCTVKNFLLIILFLTMEQVPGSLFSQDIRTSFAAPVSAADTLEYLPVWYAGALEYNLMIASSKGLVTEIERLIKQGADINAYDEDGATPLIFAVYNNKPEAVRELLKHSPGLDNFTVNWETALLIAVKNNNETIAEDLIRAGSDIDFTDNHGASPLHYSVYYGYLDMTDMLLYYSASVDTKSDEGFTPLHTAVWAGHPDISDLLIQNGANMEARDDDGDTPFLIAAAGGDTLIMELLNTFGVDVFARNKYGHNAMSLAIAYGHKNVVSYLLSESQVWKNTDSLKYDPVNISVKYGQKDITELLKKNDFSDRIRHSPDQIAISGLAKFTLHDYYSGLRISAKDPYFNTGILAGIDTKLWSTRIIREASEGEYYQYYDKSSVAYGGLFRDFILTKNPDRVRTVLSASLSGAYMFGNKYRGTNIRPESGFRLIPGISLTWNKDPFSFFISGEYMKTDQYKAGGLWYRTGLTYNYSLKKFILKKKKINWN